MSTLYENIPSRPVVVREIEGKGKGLVTTRTLKPGELVLAEFPLLIGFITHTGGQGSPGESLGLRVRSLIQSFNGLVPEQQALVMTLHAQEATKNSVNHPELGEKDKKLLRIFGSNNIEVDKDRSGLYETASRINHSCSPNAFWQVEASNTKLTVRTCRAVDAEEEIVVDYHMFNNFPTRTERLSIIHGARLFICRFAKLKRITGNLVLSPGAIFARCPSQRWRGMIVRGRGFDSCS